MITASSEGDQYPEHLPSNFNVQQQLLMIGPPSQFYKFTSFTTPRQTSDQIDVIKIKTKKEPSTLQF